MRNCLDKEGMGITVEVVTYDTINLGEIMPTRIADAVWNGNLSEGSGIMKLGSGAYEGKYSFATRFGETPGTNPEELIAAAHAGCFSMALSGILASAGYKPESIHTTARVSVDKIGDGFSITISALTTEAKIPDIDDAAFQKLAHEAKAGCPVSKALSAIDITLDAKLI